MPVKRMFGSKHRESLWIGQRTAAYREGLSDGSYCICNLCGLPVYKTDAWDESHDPGRAKAFGGKVTGIAHRACNRRHGAEVVTPAVAKANAQRRFDQGIDGPGLGRNPLPAGRRSGLSRSMAGRVSVRLTLPQKLARMRAKRAVVEEGAKRAIAPEAST